MHIPLLYAAATREFRCIGALFDHLVSAELATIAVSLTALNYHLTYTFVYIIIRMYAHSVCN